MRCRERSPHCWHHLSQRFIFPSDDDCGAILRHFRNDLFLAGGRKAWSTLYPRVLSKTNGPVRQFVKKVFWTKRYRNASMLFIVFICSTACLLALPLVYNFDKRYTSHVVLPLILKAVSVVRYLLIPVSVVALCLNKQNYFRRYLDSQNKTCGFVRGI